MKLEWIEDGKRYIALYWENKLSIKDIYDYYGKFDVLQVWYPLTIDDDIFHNFGDVLGYIELEGKWGGNSYTYENSLTLSEEVIFQNISKTNRYEIRRAMNKDRIEIQYIESISEKDIDEYCSFYNEFAKSKNLNYFKNGEKEKCLAEKKMFCIARAISAEGKVLVENGYIVSQSRVLLYTSASVRMREKENINLIGRANRLLHYKSMLHFKEKGKSTYDFSGAYIGTENLEYKNITHSKKQFGGELTSYKCGYMLPLNELRVIERNLVAYKEKIAKQKIVLWGMGNFGRYILKRIQSVFCKRIDIIIDNELMKKSSEYKGESILNELDPQKYTILITMGRETCEKIKLYEICFPYMHNDNLICMRENVNE